MHIKEQVPLAPLTTLKLGGAARFLVEVTSVAQLREALAFANEHSLRWFVLGGGSNVLFTDAGFDGLIIKVALTGRAYEETDGVVRATIGAGEVFDEVVAETVAKGWWGLENLSHIPGSVGATPVQNVGAYGVEVSDVIESVEVFDTETAAVRTLNTADCGFGYRDSYFKQASGRYLITQVTFTLSTQPRPVLTYKDLLPLSQQAGVSPATIRQEVIRIRAGKFPDWHVVGTAGSFFKNPIISAARFAELQHTYPELPGFVTESGAVKILLGWVLDNVLRLRGYRKGNVELSEKQALVLVASEGATATEVAAFASWVRAQVHDAIGVEIEREVTMVE